MDLGDYANVIGIASIFIAGANFVIITVARTFWNLTFNQKKVEDEKRFIKIENSLEILENEVRGHEDKNKYFRHNFDSVTKGLEAYISSEIKHLGEMIGLQIKNILERFNEKK